jgi:hypothetical protein
MSTPAPAGLSGEARKSRKPSALVPTKKMRTSISSGGTSPESMRHAGIVRCGTGPASCNHMRPVLSVGMSRSQHRSRAPACGWIKAPSSGFGEMLKSLRDLASAIGAHAVTLRVHHTGERLRFRFKVAKHARMFRSAATAICPDLVEPRRPREGSNR